MILRQIEIGDDHLYAIQPPKWRFLLVGIIGVIVGMYYGVTFLGLMMVALGYYMRTALTISEAGLGSLTMLILVIVILIIMKPRFEMMFKYILVFLIAMLIGIAVGTVLILNGYDIHPPIDISSPLSSGNSEDNATIYPNETATLYNENIHIPSLFYNISVPFVIFMALVSSYSRRKVSDPTDDITDIKPRKVKLAVILAIGTLMLGISAGILSDKIINYINMSYDTNSPVFLTFVFVIFVIGVYAFRVSMNAK